MEKNEIIGYHVTAIIKVIYDYVFENSDRYENGWIPVELIKAELELEKYGWEPELANLSPNASFSKGGLFGLAARRLKDLDLIEFDSSTDLQSCRLKIQITI